MDYIKETIELNKERFVQELIDWLKIPSVSADPKFKDDVLKAADYLKNQFTQAGMENVQLLPTKGYPVVYADKITGSMERAISETNRRRAIQEAHNTAQGITPTGIKKAIDESMRAQVGAESKEAKTAKLNLDKIPKEEYATLIKDLSAQMDLAAANLEFEKAADLRDLVASIKAKL